MSEKQLEGLGQSMLGAIPPIAQLPNPTVQCAPGQAGEVLFQSYSPVDFYSVIDAPLDTPTTCIGELHLPDQLAGQVPAVVFLPGSGGYLEQDRRANWIAWFLANGRAVLFVDHYRPRGIDPDKDYGVSLLAISLFDRAADAYGALNLLDQHPNIDSSNILLMGLSLGGATARYAMDERFRVAYSPKHPGFYGFIDFYGPCAEDLGTKQTNGRPLLTARGTKDASNDRAVIAEAVDHYRSIGVPVVDKVYEGSPHGWDATHPPVLLKNTPYIVGCNTSYDDKGIPHYKGTALPVAPDGSDRQEKIQARIATMGAAAGDLRFGYFNGRDENTAQRAEGDLGDFMDSLAGTRVPSAR